MSAPAPEGNFYLRADGAIADADDNFLQLIGYTHEELLAGRVRWTDLTPEEFAAQDKRMLRRVLTRGSTGAFHKVFLKKNGERVPVVLRANLSEPGSDEGFALCYRADPSAQEFEAPISDSDDSRSDPLGLYRTRALQLTGYLGGGIAGVVAGLGLAGWMLDITEMASFHASFIPMAPLTTLCILLLVLALSGAMSQLGPSSRRWIVAIPAVFVGVVALWILKGFFQGTDGPLETILAPNAGRFGEVPLGRMSPLTAMSLLLCSVSLCLTLSLNALWRHFGGFSATACLLLDGVVLLGYAYKAPLLYGGTIIPMALTTTLAIFALATGAVAANGTQFLPLRPFAGNSARAILLRSFLPIAPVVVIVNAVFSNLLPQGNPAVHSALLVLLTSLIIGGAIINTAARLARRMDATEQRRRQAEESLEQHAHVLARQAARLDLAQSAIIVLDLKGIIRFWSRGAERVYGYSREHALGRSIVQMLRPEYPWPRDQIEREVLEKGTWAGELVHHDASGARLHIDARWSLERGIDGAPEGVLQINNDVSDKHMMDAALRQQLRRNVLLNTLARAIGERQDLRSISNVVLQQIEEHLPLAFTSLTSFDSRSLARESVLAGPKSTWCAEILRAPFERQEEIGHLVSMSCQQGEVVHWADTRQEQAPLAMRFAQAGYHSVVVIPIIVASKVLGIILAGRKAPEAFIEEEVLFLQQLSEHMPLGVQDALLYQDLLNAYEELKKSRDAAMQQERLRALGQMASGIAHDVNNALSPIVGYADLLLSGEMELQEEAKQSISTILRAANDIAEIVARLRQFYQAPGEEPREMAPVSLPQIVEQSVQLMQPRWKAANEANDIRLEMHVEVAEDTPPVPGIASELREALINLIINALDAMPKGGSLTLRVFQEDPHVQVMVRDTGMGMDQDTLQRCLEPFFTTKGTRGTGLGLGMVYGIVQRHAGTVHVESTLGVGTTVRLSFPIAQCADTASEQPALAQPRAGLRILVVDDELVLRQLVREMLERDDHLVETAEDGHIALKKFKAAQQQNLPFDLVITDLGMPEMGGRRVAQLMKEQCPGIPVILLTGWGARMRAEQDKPVEVDAVIAKPPRLDTLRGTISRVLMLKEMRCREAEHSDSGEQDMVSP